MDKEKLTVKERAFVEEHERWHKERQRDLKDLANEATDYPINSELENAMKDDVGAKVIEEALLMYWGERCEAYEAGCGVCEGWKAFDEAFPKEVLRVPENVKTVIFDIDGTLADVEHRVHFAREKDFDSFFDAMGDDTVNEPIADLLYFHLYKGVQIIFCSGRPDNYRGITEDWLLEKLGWYMFGHNGWQAQDTLAEPYLFMRPEKKRMVPDYEVKKELLDEILKYVDKENILYAVDDRQQVVDMWRNNGITCLQVADGNF
tara:strand:- start:543 stop:1325 length:783 start_codon:yes stop_codon:yes gene_type:complete